MMETHSTARSTTDSETQSLRVEVRELRARLQQVEAENRMLLKRIAELVEMHAAESNKDRQLALQLEIKILQSRLSQRNREMFAKKSEKRGRPDDAPKPDKPAPKRKRTGSARTNRQVSTMRRAGLRMSRQAVWDQLNALAALLEQNYLAQHDWMLGSHELLHADETSWRTMLKGGSTKWWLWVLAAKDGFFCLAMPTRSAKAGRQLLRDFDGALMADAYTVYKKLAKEAAQGGLALGDDQPWQPRFALFVCWSHARRPFEQTAKSDGDADVILDLIAALYEVEARAKKLADGDEAKLIELRRSLRATESTDIIEKIRQWRTTCLALPGTTARRWAGVLREPMVGVDWVFNQSTRAIR